MKTYLTADDYPSDTNPAVMMLIRARSSLNRVLEIIHAAGDCSVSIIGRRFNGDKIVALVNHLELLLYADMKTFRNRYMMPIEKIIDSAFPNTNSFDGPKTVKYTSKDERRAFIDQLVALVDRLHSRKIIHGDIICSCALTVNSDSATLTMLALSTRTSSIRIFARLLTHLGVALCFHVSRLHMQKIDMLWGW